MLMELCWRSSLRYEAKNAARGVGEKKIKRSVEKEREREREGGGKRKRGGNR